MKNKAYLFSFLSSKENIVSWLNLFLRVMGPIFLAPAVIKIFTVDQAYLWFLSLTILQFSLLIDLGLTPTITRHYAYLKSSKCCNLKLAGSVIFLYMVLAIFGLAFIAYLLPSYIAKPGVKHSELSSLITYTILLGFLFSLMANPLKGFLEGTGYVYEIRKAEIFSSIFQIGGSLFAVVFFSNFLLAFLIFNLSSCIYFIQLLRKIFSYYPESFFEIKSTEFSLNKIISDSVRAGLATLLNLGSYYFLILYASKLMDISSATMFMALLNYSRAAFNFCMVNLYNNLQKLSYQFQKETILQYLSTAKHVIFSTLSLLIIISQVLPLIIYIYFKNIASGFQHTNFLILYFLSISLCAERVVALLLHVLSTAKIIIWHKVYFSYSFVLIGSFLTFNEYFHIFSILSLVTFSLFLSGLISLLYVTLIFLSIKNHIPKGFLHD